MLVDRRGLWAAVQRGWPIPWQYRQLKGAGSSLSEVGGRCRVPSWWVRRSQARISAIFLEGP